MVNSFARLSEVMLERLSIAALPRNLRCKAPFSDIVQFCRSGVVANLESASGLEPKAISGLHLDSVINYRAAAVIF
jgi:hypothetical protein